jgi:hypothetical protein
LNYTTSVRGTQFEAAVKTHFLKAGAFDAQGIVTVPAIRAIRLLECWMRNKSGQSKSLCVDGSDCLALINVPEVVAAPPFSAPCSIRRV